MIYFDSDMSKSTNTVVCFDWKTVIYIYASRKCRTQFMLPMEKSVTFWLITGACANEIIPSINRSFVYKAKEGRNVRICDKVFQWISTGRWFFQGTQVSSTNKTDRHDITEILLKVALNTINHKPTILFQSKIKYEK